jgi:signal peptidase I
MKQHHAASSSLYLGGKMNLMKLAGNVVYGFCIILFLAAALIILAPFIGWHVSTVMSGSMEPTIPVGGMVILGPVAADDIRVGEIIAFTRGDVEICHRVIAIDVGPPLRFTTKGDNNGAPDVTTVTQENVNGRLIASIPLAGYAAHFIKTPLGLFMTIILPLLILIGSELKTLILDDK